MTRRVKQVTQLVVVAATLSLLWPAPAHAQRHGRGRPHRAVFVRAAYGGPFFYPGFYHPGFYYSAFGGPFGWYGHPWGAWGPWPAYGYYDATSSARIQGAPPQAEVYVDGYYAGIVDDFDGAFQRLRVPPGEHELVIYLEGYRSTKQNILFRPRAGYKINAALEKLPAGEQAEPRPTPSANPNPQRSHPQGPDRGPRDRHRDRGEQMRGEPADASGFGTLAVRVQPAGASILVDGERWEGSDTTGERLIVQLAEGRHRVEVQREGYQPYATDVEVRSGETATLNVSLPQERQ